MRCRDDVQGLLAVHSNLLDEVEHAEDANEAACGRGVPVIETERLRLENERKACEASLKELNVNLQNLEAERERLRGVVEPDPPARLRLLASMSDELRTALHAILGYVQLFRIRGGLDPVQTEWVDAMLAAGAQLLAQVHCVVGLADIDASPGEWLFDEDKLAMGRQVYPVAPHPAGDGSGRPDGSEKRGHPVLRVLVADDVAMNRDIACAFIRAAGHSVIVAETGKQAVSAAETADFDVILMDVRMPEMDGLEASRRIRALPGSRGHVPIIALTAQAFSGKVEACRAAGMNGHLAKPFRFDTLNDAILAAAAEARTQLGAPVPSAIFMHGARAGSRSSVCAVPAAAEARGDNHAWIDIASPWNSTSGGSGSTKSAPQGTYILDTQFKVKLTPIGLNRGRRLVAGPVRTCAPARDRSQHEFHWLLYTDPAPADVRAYTATCDLWRWSGFIWHSIAVPGAHFSPDEMYEQGWRYCGPCVEKTAMVEVV